MPDHTSLFALLATNLEKSQPPVFVATLCSENFTSVKNVVISMVSQILSTNDDDDHADDDSDVRKYFLIIQILLLFIYIFKNKLGFRKMK